MLTDQGSYCHLLEAICLITMGQAREMCGDAPGIRYQAHRLRHRLHHACSSPEQTCSMTPTAATAKNAVEAGVLAAQLHLDFYPYQYHTRKASRQSGTSDDMSSERCQGAARAVRRTYALPIHRCSPKAKLE